MLVLPMLGLTAGTIGLSWFAFTKSQLQAMVYELAVIQSEPDTDLSELTTYAEQAMQTRFKLGHFALEVTSGSVLLTVPSSEFAGPFALVIPEIAVESHVPKQA